MQPLSMSDITAYASSVLCIDGKMSKLFFRYMEEVDNVVLSDYYSKTGK